VQSLTHLLQLVQFQLITRRGFNPRSKVPILSRLESSKKKEREFSAGISKFDELSGMVSHLLEGAEAAVTELVSERKKCMLLEKELDLEK